MALRRFLFRLVLEEAIRREEEAYRFYEAARETAREAAARELLRQLCAEELRHRLKLEELQRKGELDQALEAETTREEELLHDSGPAPDPDLAALQPADVWRLALRKEQLAVEHYGLLARKAVLRTPRQVFALLAAEEGRHVRWARAALEGLAGG
jgi:rubrerythrin